MYRTPTTLYFWLVCLTGMLLTAVPGYSQGPGWRKHMQAGRIAFDKRDLGRAEKAFQAAIKEAERSGPNLPLAESLDGLAEVYIAQGKKNEAEPLYKRSLEIREKALGPDHLDLANSIDKIADLYTAQHRRSEAEPLYERSKAIREKALAEHPDIYTFVDGKLVRREPK